MEEFNLATIANIRDMLQLSMAAAEADAWLSSPHAGLSGRTPLLCFQQGEFAEVYACALAL